MSQRGRGTLEVAPSRNPFFQTTSSDVGPKTRDRIDWKYDVNPSLVSTNTYNNDGNFSFLYTRTSDAIGSKIPQPQSDTLKMMTRTEFLKKRREELVASGAAATAAELQPAEPPRACAEDILKTYKHVPKLEDPRYTTSNNDYGVKVPTVATFVAERAARKQGFSKSFNNIKPQNTSLNTAVTRSQVHPALDPQFV